MRRKSQAIQKNESLMRLPQVLQVFPVSKSAWWNGIKRGIYPRGIKLSHRCTAWRASEIHALLERTITENAE